jgi:hypothetical protein
MFVFMKLLCIIVYVDSAQYRILIDGTALNIGLAKIVAQYLYLFRIFLLYTFS